MRSKYFLAAAILGAATFAAALYFQYVEGLAPCKLCIWQRYGLAVGIGGALLAALFSHSRSAVVPGAIAAMGFIAEAGAAFYHTGVEQKWWAGPSTCSGTTLNVGTFAPDKLGNWLDSGKAAPRCDEIPWDFLGLSMANWNVPIALGFALLCLMGMRRVARG